MNELFPEIAMQILEKFEGVSLTDEVGRIVWANKNWLKFNDFTLEGIRNKYVWDVITETRVRQVLEKKEPLISEFFIIKNHQAAVSYYPLFNEEKFYGVVIFVIINGKEHADKLIRKIEILNKKLTETEKKLKVLSKANYSINQIIGESDAIYKLKEEIVAAARQCRQHKRVNEENVRPVSPFSTILQTN